MVDLKIGSKCCGLLVTNWSNPVRTDQNWLEELMVGLARPTINCFKLKTLIFFLTAVESGKLHAQLGWIIPSTPFSRLVQFLEQYLS